LARAYTKEAIEALVTGLKAKAPTVRITAAQALLDRGWGKPSQHVDITGNLTLEQLVLQASMIAAREDPLLIEGVSLPSVDGNLTA